MSANDPSGHSRPGWIATFQRCPVFENNTAARAATRPGNPVGYTAFMGQNGHSLREAVMTKSQDLRKEADNCSELASKSSDGAKTTRYRRMAISWNRLAATQEWLDGERADNPKPTPSWRAP
jgi:hypothetical protein